MTKTQYFFVSAAINLLVTLGTTRGYDLLETPYVKEQPLENNPNHSRNTGLENTIKNN